MTTQYIFGLLTGAVIGCVIGRHVIPWNGKPQKKSSVIVAVAAMALLSVVVLAHWL